MKTVKKILFGFMLVVFGLTNLSMVNAMAQMDVLDSNIGDKADPKDYSYDVKGDLPDYQGGNGGGGGGTTQPNNPGGGGGSQGGSSSTSVYTDILGETLKDPSLSSAEVGSETKNKTGGDLFTQQVVDLIDYAIDVFIMIGIAIAFFGGYKIMFSDKEDAYKEGINLIIYGVIGIILMVSAKFISGALVGDGGILSDQRSEVNPQGPNGVQIAQQLYERVLYPFIKLVLYLIVGLLFFIMATKVFTFIISTDETAKKKAGGIILWTTIGMFIILGAKQIVEAVMGNEIQILNDQAQYIKEIGDLPTSFGHIAIIHNILNWVMGLSMFVVLVLVVIQGYRMFAKPDDPKNRERLKKTLLYIIIGVLVVGASYVISSILTINAIPETVVAANP